MKVCLLSMAVSIPLTVMFVFLARLQHHQELYQHAVRAADAAATSTLQTTTTTTTKTSETKGRPSSSQGSSLLASHHVDCIELLEKFSGGRVGYKDPNAGQLIVATANQTPSQRHFAVSMHRKQFDKVRWAIYESRRYYEFALEEAWAEILRQAPPGSRVLDVGGNIGYYSLFSASLGEFVIDTFEPNAVNLLRACQSLQHNQWQSEFDTTMTHSIRNNQGNQKQQHRNYPAVNLWQWGASNTTGSLWFVDNNNPGAGKFMEGAPSDSTGLVRSDRTETIRSLDVITLDDFAEARGWFHDIKKKGEEQSAPRIEILKVDVEGHQAQVFQGAQKLLRQHWVRHIFTEVSKTSVERARETFQALTDTGYTLCGWGAFRGPTPDPLPFDTRNVASLFENFWANKSELKGIAVNLWWQADASCREGRKGAAGNVLYTSVQP